MSQDPINPNRFSPDVVRVPVQLANQKLVWHTLNRCGFRTCGFNTNEHLEVYYDIQTREKHDVGYISKGWEDPGFRVGNVIELPMARIKAKQDQLPALMKHCATRGFAMTGEKLAGDSFEFHLDSVIYADGFNKRVLYKVLECLSDCTDKLRSTFVSAESDAVPPALLPAEFHFSIGDYYDGPCHELEWKHRTLWYRWAKYPSLWQPATELCPGAEAWEHFWQAVGDAGVWQWDDNYGDSDVIHGTRWLWSLTLTHLDQRLTSVGSDVYPGCKKAVYSKTCEFGRFIKALQKLTGKSDLG